MELKEQLKQELLSQKEKERLKRVESNKNIPELIIYSEGKDSPVSSGITKFFDNEGIKYIEKTRVDDVDEVSRAVSNTNLNSLPIIFVNETYLVFKRDWSNANQLIQNIKYVTSPNYKAPNINEGLVEWLKTSNYRLFTRINQLEQKLAPMIKVMADLAKEENEQKNN